MHPISDSRGVYRYVVGIQSEFGATSKSAQAVIDAVRHLIPCKFPASLCESSHRRVQAFDLLNSAHQYDETLLQLVRVACLNNLRSSLEALLRYPRATEQFQLAMPSVESRSRLQLVLEVSTVNHRSRQTVGFACPFYM